MGPARDPRAAVGRAETVVVWGHPPCPGLHHEAGHLWDSLRVWGLLLYLLLPLLGPDPPLYTCLIVHMGSVVPVRTGSPQTSQEASSTSLRKHWARGTGEPSQARCRPPALDAPHPGPWAPGKGCFMKDPWARACSGSKQRRDSPLLSAPPPPRPGSARPVPAVYTVSKSAPSRQLAWDLRPARGRHALGWSRGSPGLSDRPARTCPPCGRVGRVRVSPPSAGTGLPELGPPPRSTASRAGSGVPSPSPPLPPLRPAHPLRGERARARGRGAGAERGGAGAEAGRGGGGAGRGPPPKTRTRALPD